MMNDMNYTIAEDFILPSGGKIYGTNFDPHIKLRSMTVRDEMKRLSQTNTPYKSLCEIIDSCLLTKLPISSYDMCIGDYEYLLHKLRIVSYGPEYKMTVGCPNKDCLSVHDEIVNLDELKIKEFSLDEFKNDQTFTLPVSSKLVSISFQTPRLLDQLDLEVKEYKRKNVGITYDPTPLILLKQVIDSVNGNKLNIVEVEAFINTLPARDYNYITLKLAQLNNLIGLNTTLDITCSHCGNTFKSFFRSGLEFFRPTTDK